MLAELSSLFVEFFIQGGQIFRGFSGQKIFLGLENFEKCYIDRCTEQAVIYLAFWRNG
jgi:hypothetical protein